MFAMIQDEMSSFFLPTITDKTTGQQVCHRDEKGGV